MKTITMFLLLFLVAFFLTCVNSKAQQPTSSSSLSNQVSAYTFKVFQAPDKMYGYDIFMNNKIVHHQPAALPKQDNSMLILTKEDQAQKAALFVISKMKNNQPVSLTKEEIKKLNGR